jgi:hypothetical protein
VNALDHLDSGTTRTIRLVLGSRAPLLLRALEQSERPSMSIREKVEDVLADELVPEFTGPDWEPTSYGLRVESAIVRFLEVHQITRPTKGHAWPPVPDLRGPQREGRG